MMKRLIAAAVLALLAGCSSMQHYASQSSGGNPSGMGGTGAGHDDERLFHSWIN
jgi:uncharacterized protein YceK